MQETPNWSRRQKTILLLLPGPTKGTLESKVPKSTDTEYKSIGTYSSVEATVEEKRRNINIVTHIEQHTGVYEKAFQL